MNNQKKSINFEFLTITNDIDEEIIKKVLEYMSRSYWANRRAEEITRKAIKNSLCFSLFYKGIQIGFARVITDYTTHAYLCDVFIDENFRGFGVGQWFINEMLDYPDLKGMKRWFLLTKDAQTFYQKKGFKFLEDCKKYLELVRE